MNATLLKTASSSLLSAVLLTTSVCAQAQAPAAAYPQKTVEITVPFPAGGGVDLLARLLGSQLSANGQAVVVENRAGAGGTVGTRYVVGRPKDGHSLLMMNDSYALAPAVYRKLGFDPKKDLEAVINIAWAPMLVVVPASSKFKTLADLVAAGAKPGAELSYASCGAGTDPHLAGEMLNQSFKMHAVHVPYKGCSPAIVDVMGAQVDYGVVTISGALPYLGSGKLHALAITAKERSKAAPSVPTVAESGAPGYELNQWQGLAVPGGTPKEVKQQVYQTVSNIMKTEAMQKKLLELGYTPADDNPAAFQKIVNDDVEKFAALVKKIGLSLD